jgi:hypothetical protein
MYHTVCHIASGADHLIKARNLYFLPLHELHPCILRHNLTTLHIFFMKSSTILKSSFAVAPLLIGLQKSMSSLIVIPSAYHI